MSRLENMINEFMLKRASDRNASRAEYEAQKRAEGRFKFYPSSIGKCSRAVVYDMLGYPKAEIPSRVLRIFDNGDDMHLRYQNMFAEMGILIAPELPIKNEELCISGRTDALIRLDGEPVLVELKSANTKSFERMKRDNLPKDEYVMQLQLYLHLTGFDKGIVLVENKNDQEMFEYSVTYDKEMSSGLISKIVSCVGCAKQGVLPDRPYTKSSYNCRYCDFADRCWSKED